MRRSRTEPLDDTKAGWKARRNARDWLAASTGALIGVVLWGACFLVVDQVRGPQDIFETVYLPAASAWGLDENDLQTTQGRFAFLYTAKQWRAAMFGVPISQIPYRIVTYARAMLVDFPLLAVPLIPVGIVAVIRRHRSVAFLLLAWLLVHYVYTLNYAIRDIRTYYIFGYIALVVFVAAGISSVFTNVARRRSLGRAGTWIMSLVAALAIWGPQIPEVGGC